MIDSTRRFGVLEEMVEKSLGWAASWGRKLRRLGPGEEGPGDTLEAARALVRGWRLDYKGDLARGLALYIGRVEELAARPDWKAKVDWEERHFPVFSRWERDQLEASGRSEQWSTSAEQWAVMGWPVKEGQEGLEVGQGTRKMVVYSLWQTEIEDLDEFFEGPARVPAVEEARAMWGEEGSARVVGLLAEFAATRLGYTALGAQEGSMGQAVGEARYKERQLWVEGGRGAAGQARILLHEIGHVLLPRGGQEWQREMDAEAFACVTGAMLGIDSMDKCAAYQIQYRNQHFMDRLKKEGVVVRAANGLLVGLAALGLEKGMMLPMVMPAGLAAYTEQMAEVAGLA